MKFYLALALSAAASAVAEPWGRQHGGRRQHGQHHEVQFHDHHWKGHFNHRLDHNGRKGRQGCQRMPPVYDPTPDVPTKGNTSFTQFIDHKNPHLGTFQQKYWWNTEFWKGPGSPIIVFTPGESNATDYQGYLTNRTTPGVIAQRTGGATLMIEHRYWGFSAPFVDLSTENLQYLTLENSIADLTHFAQTVKLPFALHGSNAADAAWVMSGGSYSGALAAWTESTAPGIYQAYHASSAPVEAISDYWSYFTPIQENMAKNCSKDMSTVVEYMDNILMTGTAEAKKTLKTQFGMQDLADDDFMSVLTLAPSQWQGNQFYTGYSSFFVMCDVLEGVYTAGAPPPTADGVGLVSALTNFAAYFKTIFIPGYCEGYGPQYPQWQGQNNTKCFDMHDATNPLYTDHTVSNLADRQWVFMTCNEPFGYWQGGAPEGRSSLVSRLITPEYFIEQCKKYFPEGKNGATFGIDSGRTEDQVNKYTKGWNTRPSHNLVYGNGGADPWRESGVSSSIRPGGPLQSTAQVPVHVIPGGFHTTDMLTASGTYNAGAKVVIDAIVDQMVEWIGEFKPKRHHWYA